MFSDIGDVKLPPKLLHSKANQIGPEDRFLKDDFCWCVRANLLGGDIDEDYSFHQILAYMNALGVESDDYDVAKPGDERRQTELGKEIWENYMQVELSPKRREVIEVSES